MLPAYCANMAPILCRWIPFLNHPIDNNCKIKGKALFGKNKTWRGLISGVVLAIIITYIQYLLYANSFFQSISLLNYNQWLVLGFLLGFGALMGDLIESGIKRQLGFTEGKPFVPFDQIDFVIGALLASFIVIIPPVKVLLIVIVVSPFLHILINHIAYYTNVRKEKW